MSWPVTSTKRPSTTLTKSKKVIVSILKRKKSDKSNGESVKMVEKKQIEFKVPFPMYQRPVASLDAGTFIYDHRLSKSVSRSTMVGQDGFFRQIITFFSMLLFVVSFPFSLIFCFRIVQEYERVVIFRLGELLSPDPKGPGLFFVLPCIDNYRKIDLRTVSYDVPPQEILSKDSVTVTVDAVVYFRTYDPTASVTNVNDAFYSTKLLAQTTLRNVLGTKTLSEMLSDRDEISQQAQISLDEGTDPWGIKVERVEMKDIRLNEQLTRAMAAEAEATRAARARVIAADGEQKASHSLRDAANVISQSPVALQLRHLQTLVHIGSDKNHTVIFPVPVDLIKQIQEKIKARYSSSNKPTTKAS